MFQLVRIVQQGHFTTKATPITKVCNLLGNPEGRRDRLMDYFWSRGLPPLTHTHISKPDLCLSTTKKYLKATCQLPPAVVGGLANTAVSLIMKMKVTSDSIEKFSGIGLYILQ